ncbi:MAG: hypothetical protein IJG38_02255 [Thermoguttaceae bacterium]|nr:hypothetical protein [Thermoguttaceae bacterium]
MSSKNNKESEPVPPSICGLETEVWSRPCGYYRPTKNWNKGKVEEFKERKHFEVKGGCKCSCH